MEELVRGLQHLGEIDNISCTGSVQWLLDVFTIVDESFCSQLYPHALKKSWVVARISDQSSITVWLR